MSADFNPEQKRYLEGFASGLQTARAARASAPPAGAEPAGPDAAHHRAMVRFEAEGKNLSRKRRASARNMLSTPTGD